MPETTTEPGRDGRDSRDLPGVGRVPSSLPPLGGARLDSLPPPAELEELDLGWGATDEGPVTLAPPPKSPRPAVGAPSVDGDGRVADLQRLVTFADERAGELEGELARERAARTAAEARVADLEASLALQAEQLTELAAVQGSATDLAAALASAERTILELRAELATTRAAAGSGVAVADDLQAIRGIGPKVAARLGALGFTTYAQLAALTDEDLPPLAELLGVYLKRIEREGWVESARALVTGLQEPQEIADEGDPARG